MNRGIGVSRPHTLRGFPAGWIDWGRLDFEAVLGHAATAFAGEPIAVVARSVGGLLIGLTPSNHRIHRVFTMGAQFAHWRDYARAHRVRLLLKWHLEMPALTTLLGYFPGRRLGWMEDAPRGVVRDWTARSPCFEDAYRRRARVLPSAIGVGEIGHFAFFHSRFAKTLGPIAQRWLCTGDLAPELSPCVVPKDGGRFGEPEPGSATA